MYETPISSERFNTLEIVNAIKNQHELIYNSLSELSKMLNPILDENDSVTPTGTMPEYYATPLNHELRGILEGAASIHQRINDISFKVRL